MWFPHCSNLYETVTEFIKEKYPQSSESNHAPPLPVVCARLDFFYMLWPEQNKMSQEILNIGIDTQIQLYYIIPDIKEIYKEV